MDVYLVRHAIAAQRDPDKWPDDRGRPLTADGEKRFRKAAGGLGKLVPTVGRVLASPLERAWHTAEILHQEIGWPQPAPLEELEPDGSPQEAVAALAPFRLDRSVAVVGHEPGLSGLASYLLVGSDAGVDLELKKGGAAMLSLDGDTKPGSALLRWLLTPKVLRSL